MKSFSGMWIIVACIGIAAGNTAFALDAPKPAVASQGTGTQGPTEDPRITVALPLMSPLAAEVPLAMVSDDVVTVRDLTNALAASHEERDPASGHIGKIDFRMILDRIINVRLVVQEAAAIGLDELPEFTSAMEGYAAKQRAEHLMKEVTKDVKVADPAAVEKQYKEIVVEWKLKSLFFEKEADAKGMAEAIKAGQSFEEIAAKAVADKKAKGIEEGSYVKPRDLSPHVMEAVATMGTGSISPLLPVQSGKTTGFTIIKLEDKRYPDDPAARERAEKAVLSAKRSAVWEQYKSSLLKKYVKTRDKFIKDLDLESPKADLAKLMKDTRVVAEIKGEKPITVGQLMEALQEKHYHGLAQAAKSKKLNKDKRPALFTIISKRVIEKDAAERRIAEKAEYQRDLKEQRNSTLFGMFVARVVSPDVKLTEEDVKAYFEGHKQEYQYPEMMKMTSLAFRDKPNAESALAALRKGAEINWVRSNAEGLVTASEDEQLSLQGSVVSTKSLPPALAKAVDGARKGDLRLYESPGEQFHVLFIEDVMPARQQPYEEVRELIAQKAYNEKFTRDMEGWFAKLREASTVRFYLVDTGK